MAKKKEGFLSSTRKEFKKITWPSKKDTLDYSLLVLVVSIITGVLIWVLDLIFGNLLGFLM